MESGLAAELQHAVKVSGMGKEAKAKADNGTQTRKPTAREARDVGQRLC